MGLEPSVCFIPGNVKRTTFSKKEMSFNNQFSLLIVGWFFLVISSAIYFTYFVYFLQPATNLIHQKPESRARTNAMTEVLKLGEETVEDLVEKLNQENQMLKDNVNRCREDRTGMVALLETGQESLGQINTTLTAKIVLLEGELKQEKEQADRLAKTIAEEKKSIEANVRIQKELFDFVSLVSRNGPYPGVANYTTYAVARLGLLPLTNVEPLEPDFGPVINNVTSFQYSTTIPPCREVRINRSVFISVNSAPGNFEKRNIIRQTWAKHLQAENEKGSLGVGGFAFILGLADNDVTQNRIKEESETFGDIIQVKMSDFYRNLTLKVAGLLNWLHRNCATIDFVLKVDDDVYVNARNLATFVQSYHRSNHSMFGLSAGFFIANRVGKWNISYEEWPWKQYPPYYYGPAIIMPGSTVRPLLAAFQTTPFMPFDDVYYSGICTEKAGIKIHVSSNSFNVFVMRQSLVPDACDVRRFVAWLTVSGNHMNNSHVATDDFYHNRTQCIVSDSHGTNRTIDYNEAVQFLFV
ncbi:uncharacterized protein LOC116920928 [Daphnia magna]|uniref:uncharacterized protein LOC116920928 n=1 Tax=Daphnia magna TaxID=35525 RepID=UPI001E1B9F52|nr:uncharacterized protein LOC116920928 [Daphnia magna]